VLTLEAKQSATTKSVLGQARGLVFGYLDSFIVLFLVAQVHSLFVEPVNRVNYAP
jgi:hypothetical protein